MVWRWAKLLKTLQKGSWTTSAPFDESPLSEQEIAALNIKMAGYEMARRLAARKGARIVENRPDDMLCCKPSTQADLDSDWCAYWARELGIGFAYHRKLWELSYVLQALSTRGCLEPGRTGVVFGCGRESVPSYCAGHGIHVLATDIPRSDSYAQGWIETGQHAASLSELHHPHLCTREQLTAFVKRRDVDMNEIPADIRDYDFCWSVCALEHLGSIERGLAFVEKSLGVLKPGGIAIHTTEFAFLNIDRTFDRGPTVLFLRKHFEQLRDRLAKSGHTLAPLDFDVGSGPMDKFIDGPPFPGSRRSHLLAHWPESYHIKVSYEGIPTTCFGLIVQKRS